MPKYMTQKMSSGTLPAKLYYRKQKVDHPSHEESEQFTRDAKANYAAFNHIPESRVEEGKYESGQGVPTASNRYEI